MTRKSIIPTLITAMNLHQLTFKKIKELWKKYFLFILLGLLLIAIPISVALQNREQDIRQDASDSQIASSSALLNDFILNPQTQRNSVTEPFAVSFHTFKIIYFYPSDYTPNQQLINKINPFVADVQSWMLGKIGRTFDYQPVQVIRGDRAAAQYGTGTDSFYSIYNEVKAKTNAVTTDNYIIYVAETIQFSCCAVFFGSGNYQSTTGNGYSMIDDAVFDPDLIGPGQNCRNGDPFNSTAACSRNARRGGTAHEIGHMLSLPHPDCNTDNCTSTVMYHWWDYPTAGFLNSSTAPELNELLASPWMWRTSLGATPTLLVTSTSTPIPSSTQTPTATPTRTPTPIPSHTPSPTRTPTPTITPTRTPTPTVSPTRTPTPTATPTPTPTVPPATTGDLNNDNTVNVFDLSLLLSAWNTNNSQRDFNHDGTINVFDLSILLSNWDS